MTIIIIMSRMSQVTQHCKTLTRSNRSFTCQTAYHAYKHRQRTWNCYGHCYFSTSIS